MCKYCNGDKDLISDQEICNMYISGELIRIDTGFDEIAIKVNFCPMCGRDLKESNR